MSMNRQQKRMLQKQGEIDADGAPVRSRNALSGASPQERTSPGQFLREVRAEPEGGLADPRRDDQLLDRRVDHHHHPGRDDLWARLVVLDLHPRALRQQLSFMTDDTTIEPEAADEASDAEAPADAVSVGAGLANEWTGGEPMSGRPETETGSADVEVLDEDALLEAGEDDDESATSRRSIVPASGSCFTPSRATRRRSSRTSRPASPR